MTARKIYLFPDLRKIGIAWTRQYIYRLEDAGRFPRRFRLGDRQVAWSAEEVDQWLEERIARREPQAA